MKHVPPKRLQTGKANPKRPHSPKEQKIKCREQAIEETHPRKVFQITLPKLTREYQRH